MEQAELVRLQREPDLGRRVVKAITAGTHWPPGTVCVGPSVVIFLTLSVQELDKLCAE